MEGAFSHEIRVIACDRCGAPVQAFPAAGSFKCEYCNSVNHLQVRTEQPTASSQAPIDEAERLRRLRSQDGRGLQAPPDLLYLLPDGMIADHTVQLAGSTWQAIRKELRNNPSNFGVAERLVFLTMVLSTYYQVKGDLLRQRAMLESALEVLASPRHKQMMRGDLSRCACRSGDRRSAEEWLAPCDPRSDDLETDTAYRYSRACIDTAATNYQGVLATLGSSSSDVPIMANFVHVCALLRANAWEKLGDVSRATDLLAQLMAGGDSHLWAAVEKLLQLFSNWGVCTTSYPQVRARYRR